MLRSLFLNRSVAINFAANSAVHMWERDTFWTICFQLIWKSSLIMINSRYFVTCSSNKITNRKANKSENSFVNFASKMASYFADFHQIKYWYEICVYLFTTHFNFYATQNCKIKYNNNANLKLKLFGLIYSCMSNWCFKNEWKLRVMYVIHKYTCCTV